MPANDTGVYELLAALPSQIQSHVTRQDCTFLQSMLRDRSLLPLLKIHERLKQYQHQSPPPVLVYTGALAYELSRDLQSKADGEEVNELSDLLANPHVKSLFSVHDTVAQERFGPTLPPLPEDLGEQQDSVKIIQLVKSTEPLGATVKRDQGTGAIVVARVLRGGAADRSGLIHEGDELREVNGVLMDDKRPEDVAPVVVQSRGAVTFKVVPSIKEDSPGLEEEEEEEEEESPALALGCCTAEGEGEGEGEADYGAISGIHIAGLRRSFRLSRRNWRAGLCECGRSKCYDLADAPTYEEVVPYRRQPEAPYRLVLLVGPRGVGVSEMKRRLLISDPQHFGVTVPYTTRTKRGEEKDGVEYKFVSKPQFEADIIDNKFIEHGEYRGHYYGTSLDSVRSILQGNQVCLLDVPPHRIQRLRTAEFKPYVVFVKPPPMEELRLSRRNAKVTRRRDGEGSAEPFTEEDFQEMIDSTQEMEDRYGHLFEKTIVNEDMALAFRELSLALEKLETEIQWIPKSWVPR
ncbi:MAGUK p55 subfamily member 7-like [Anguilla rostrata]|uniref:MAGUK p55 subfamily member 7-like n=1 Tax=Anguilla rostrata TaxID=7938 RepID=UPI0030CDFE1C